MKFKLEIEVSKLAIQDHRSIQEAIATALHPARRNRGTISGCGRVSVGDGGKILDANGNLVGKWEVTQD